MKILRLLSALSVALLAAPMAFSSAESQGEPVKKGMVGKTELSKGKLISERSREKFMGGKDEMARKAHEQKLMKQKKAIQKRAMHKKATHKKGMKKGVKKGMKVPEKISKMPGKPATPAIMPATMIKKEIPQGVSTVAPVAPIEATSVGATEEMTVEPSYPEVEEVAVEAEEVTPEENAVIEAEVTEEPTMAAPVSPMPIVAPIAKQPEGTAKIVAPMPRDAKKVSAIGKPLIPSLLPKKPTEEVKKRAEAARVQAEKMRETMLHPGRPSTMKEKAVEKTPVKPPFKRMPPVKK